MGHVRILATATQNSGATSKAITVPFAVPIGHTLIIACVWESAAGAVPVISSVVDSRSNTYTTTPDASVNAGTTVSCAILRGRITTALQVGDTITITIGSSRARWAVEIDQFDDIIAASPLDKTATNAPASSANLSSGVTAATAQASELAVAIFGFGAGRTVTDLGGWSGGAKVESSAGTTDRGLQVTHRYVSTTGTQEGTVIISSASTYAAAIATYKIPAQPVVAGGWGFIPIK